MRKQKYLYISFLSAASSQLLRAERVVTRSLSKIIKLQSMAILVERKVRFLVPNRNFSAATSAGSYCDYYPHCFLRLIVLKLISSSFIQFNHSPSLCQCSVSGPAFSPVFRSLKMLSRSLNDLAIIEPSFSKQSANFLLFSYLSSMRSINSSSAKQKHLLAD